MTTPTPNYERFGVALAPCTVCGKTVQIARFKVTIPQGAYYVAVAAMCPPCDSLYKAGKLPTHPFWFRTPNDPAGPRQPRRS